MREKTNNFVWESRSYERKYGIKQRMKESWSSSF